MRRLVLVTMLTLPALARAQEVEEPQQAEQPPAEQAPPASELPKIAVVVAGDPDDALRHAAVRVERAVGGYLRLPFDPSLRAALRGEPGTTEDGLDEVRRERQRLGLGETSDAPVLASLGRRAGAVAVGVVRSGAEGPELVVLDVRNAAFFEGSIALAGAHDENIAEFASRRTTVAARGAAIAEPVHAQAPSAATHVDAEPEEEHQPDFFEQFWPYFVAGALLLGMVIAIAVTSASDGSSQPVLRFVPGER